MVERSISAYKTPRVARANVRVAASVLVIAASMLGLSYASVPLYDLFCRVTGYGGTTQVATTSELSATSSSPRMVTVRFDAQTSPELDWDFRPVHRTLEVNLGKSVVAEYFVRNRSDKVVTATALFNVTPPRAGEFFNKIDCFCFEEQTLAPGDTAILPVNFFIDPAMSDAPELVTTRTITLSYTFFPLDSVGTPSEKS